jgi:hypothetical protein
MGARAQYGNKERAALSLFLFLEIYVNYNYLHSTIIICLQI